MLLLLSNAGRNVLANATPWLMRRHAVPKSMAIASMALRSFSGDTGRQSNMEGVVSLVNTVCSSGPTTPLSLQLTRSRQFCKAYGELSDPDRTELLTYLSKHWSFDRDSILGSIKRFDDNDSAGKSSDDEFVRKVQKMTTVARPRFHSLLSSIGHLREGVRFLVDLRADVLQRLSTSNPQRVARCDAEYLQTLDAELKELLGYWFSVGLLQLKRVTWEAPCGLLERMADVEAVHPVRGWADIKRRVGHYRRCFVFTHPAVPNEPLVILHVALMDHVSDSIHDIVNRDSIPLNEDGEEDASKIKAAIFYSITNVFKGLQGIDLGNHLIKTVVGEIRKEFPHSDTMAFSTLSPIPGFRAWLLKEINSEQPEQLVFTDELKAGLRKLLRVETDQEVFKKLNKVLTDKRLFGDGQVRTWERYRSLLMHLCSRYLYAVKRRGFAINPVANFHLRNGSELWRLNWKADVSARGLQNSFGIMANYLYNLDRLDDSSQTYLDQQTIRVGPKVATLLDLERLLADFEDDEHSDDEVSPPSLHGEQQARLSKL